MDSNEQPKRFTSKAEITPVNPFEENNTNQLTHESAATENNKSTPSTVRHIPITTDSPFGSSQRVASPSRGSQFSNNSRATPTQEYFSPRSGRKVHYIPIYVEGSEKPVMPKNAETPVSADHMSYTSAESAPPSSQRPVESCSFGSAIPTPNSAASSKTRQSTPASHHEREVPIQVETPVSAASAPPPPPQPTPPPPKPDPLKQVQAVQQEVDDLTRHVEQFSGTTRTDKQYLYLDEMLTRNLIKLDIIEVAGNEELRMARKNVIRCIQQAIALLESKVPLKESDQSKEEESATPPTEQDGGGAEANCQPESDNVTSVESTQANQTQNSGVPPCNETPTPMETDANEIGEKTTN